jgi:MFS transporter, DHA1 family, quinolone resistance protein
MAMVTAFINRFLHWLTVGVMTTVMSLLILSKGNSLEHIGMIVAICSVVTIFLELPSGILSDLLGRKTIYLISIVLSVLGYVALIFADGFPLVALGFALYGASRAFSSGSIEAIFINDYKKRNGGDELHKLISIMNIGETIGLASGALLGGFLPTVWDTMGLGSTRYNGNLFVQIGVLVLLFGITLFSTKRDDSIKKPRIDIKSYIKQSIHLIGKNRIIKVMLIGFCLWGLCFNAIEIFWQPQLMGILDTDSQTWIFGIINSGYFLASLLGVIIINAILPLLDKKFLLAIFFNRVLIGALIVILSLQKSLFSFAAVYLVVFFFNGMSNIPETTLFNMQIPDDKRSSVISLSSLTMQIGGVLGSLLFSAMITRSAISAVWVFAGIVFSITSIVYLYPSVASKLQRGA